MNSTVLVVAIMTFLGVYFYQPVNAIPTKSDKGDKVTDADTLNAGDDDTAKNISTKFDGRRRKRAIVGQCQMMRHFLQGTGHGCLAFNGYGNWCGRGGQGGCVDDIDDCCYTHDRCWDSVKNAHNHDCFYSLYIFSDYNHDLCSRARGNTQEIKCCRCDYEFARCISRYVRGGRYNSGYSGGDRGSYVGRNCYTEWRF